MRTISQKRPRISAQVVGSLQAADSKPLHFIKMEFGNADEFSYEEE